MLRSYSWHGDKNEDVRITPVLYLFLAAAAAAALVPGGVSSRTVHLGFVVALLAVWASAIVMVVLQRRTPHRDLGLGLLFLATGMLWMEAIPLLALPMPAAFRIMGAFSFLGLGLFFARRAKRKLEIT